jgi:hypothetical protein
MAGVLLNLSYVPKTTLSIIKELINYEIGRHTSSKDIFRANSLPSKILGQFVK